MHIKFADDFVAACPGYRTIIIEAEVENSPTSDDLWQQIDAFCQSFASVTTLPDINRRPAIAATRAAYKACGKDPNRYRPSMEAMCRRVVKGMELYRSQTLIDAFNLLSMQTGCSIGVFDSDKLSGDTITLGIGREGEPYEGIGRGELNIAGLPVWRDAIGGFGTPTSDNERTKVELSTRRILVTIHLFDPSANAPEIIAGTRQLLEQYASVGCFECATIAAQ